MSQEFKADNGVLILEPEKITLKFQKMFQRPDTVILMKDIAHFELIKTPSFFFNRLGFISFQIKGDFLVHPMDSINQVYANKNALLVVSKSCYQNMVVAKILIEKYLSEVPPEEEIAASSASSSSSSSPSSAVNVIEELTKAAELRDAGILSSEEFDQLKRKLMNG